MREFEAQVVSSQGRSVVLDRTCFFPQGGGQVGDTGEISGIRVVDTRRTNDEVIHILERESAFASGQKVKGRIDWDRRYRIMRLHSAAHLVFYAMKEVFGEECRPASSGLLDDEKDRSDYLFEAPIDRAKLAEVEERVNKLIAFSLPITHAAAREDPNRLLWRIAGYEPLACGGTHVRNTVEIGRVKVERGKKPGKGKERIEISLA
jgi:alanyl-tRNA synthetase